MGYTNVYEATAKMDNLSDIDLKKYTSKCLKDMRTAFKEGPAIENILLKHGHTSYKIEITVKVFAYKEE